MLRLEVAPWAAPIGGFSHIICLCIVTMATIERHIAIQSHECNTRHYSRSRRFLMRFTHQARPQLAALAVVGDPLKQQQDHLMSNAERQQSGDVSYRLHSLRTPSQLLVPLPASWCDSRPAAPDVVAVQRRAERGTLSPAR